MNRIAALTLTVALSLSCACAVAQTKPKPKAKANDKPVAVHEAPKPEAAVVALAAPTAKADKPVELDANASMLAAYAKGETLEHVNRRLALGAYREAAQLGHGPSQKRMWELLKDTPGSESLATVYQSAAWSQKVPGVPQPLSPVRYN